MRTTCNRFGSCARHGGGVPLLAGAMGSPRRFEFVAPPPALGLVQYAEAMRMRSGLMTPPAVYFARSLFGAGGLFDRNANAVIVGLDDAGKIAARIWSANARLIRTIARERGVVERTGQDVRTFLYRAVVIRIVGHEIGHALVDVYGTEPFESEEDAADAFAGRFDALHGMDQRLGELIFQSIGCSGPTCLHGDPIERAFAYFFGYSTQLAS